jgi:hypothetical protein
VSWLSLLPSSYSFLCNRASSLVVQVRLWPASSSRRVASRHSTLHTWSALAFGLARLQATRMIVTSATTSSLTWGLWPSAQVTLRHCRAPFVSPAATLTLMLSTPPLPTFLRITCATFLSLNTQVSSLMFTSLTKTSLVTFALSCLALYLVAFDFESLDTRYAQVPSRSQLLTMSSFSFHFVKSLT